MMRYHSINHPPRRAILAFALCAWLLPTLAPAAGADDGWIPLFNGKNLDGWTVKIAHHDIGDNYANTFRVEDGVIKVSYDGYPPGQFKEQFGHLYTNLPYAHYLLRLEYLFTGKPMSDSPLWAKHNSGVMLHAASPLAMTRDQLWPVSLEFQFLGIGTGGGTQTGNICTPGTDVVFKGKFTHDHVIMGKPGSLSPDDTWVQIEAEVHGHDLIIYRVNGEEVLRYAKPTLDPLDPDARKLLAAGHPLELGSGHIALQAESQPVWFRNVMLKPLAQ